MELFEKRWWESGGIASRQQCPWPQWQPHQNCREDCHGSHRYIFIYRVELAEEVHQTSALQTNYHGMHRDISTRARMCSPPFHWHASTPPRLHACLELLFLLMTLLMQILCLLRLGRGGLLRGTDVVDGCGQEYGGEVKCVRVLWGVCVAEFCPKFDICANSAVWSQFSRLRSSPNRRARPSIDATLELQRLLRHPRTDCSLRCCNHPPYLWVVSTLRTYF